MYSTVRTLAMSPRIRCLPRRRPLSRLKGATVKAAIGFGLSLPSSGRSASRYIGWLAPPRDRKQNRSGLGPHRRRTDSAFKRGIDFFDLPIEMLKMAADIRQQSFWHDGEAILLHCSHLDQLPAPHQQTIDLTALSIRQLALTMAPNSAIRRASRASVLASRPIAPAKRRIWRGLATTTGKPTVLAASTKWRS